MDVPITEGKSDFWSGAGGALLAGGGALIGGALGQSSSKDMAKNQRRFITKQMQNAHQWEVEDLRKAGLNPILSAGGPGARGGTMASPQMNDIVGPAISSAMAAKQANTLLRMQNSQIENVVADTGKKRMEKAFIAAQKANTNVDTTWKQLEAGLAALKLPQGQANAQFFKELQTMDLKPILKMLGVEDASPAAQAAFRGLINKFIGM